MCGCGLSPFPDGLSANAPPATGVIHARGSCGEGGTASPSVAQTAFTGQPGGTLETLRDSWPAFLTLQTLPVCSMSPLLNLSGVQTPPQARSRAGQGTQTKDSSTEAPVPFAPGAATCTDLQLCTLTWREGPQTHGSRGQSPGERQSRLAGDSGSRETSQQSPAVSEWEGKRKPGNTWELQPDPGPHRVCSGLNKLEGAASDHPPQLSSAARPPHGPSCSQPRVQPGNSFTWL